MTPPPLTHTHTHTHRESESEVKLSQTSPMSAKCPWHTVNTASANIYAQTDIQTDTYTHTHTDGRTDRIDGDVMITVYTANR